MMLNAILLLATLTGLAVGNDPISHFNRNIS